MTVLREALKLCEERLGCGWCRRPGQRIGEQNTKAMLIEPVLQAGLAPVHRVGPGQAVPLFAALSRTARDQSISPGCLVRRVPRGAATDLPWSTR